MNGNTVLPHDRSLKLPESRGSHESQGKVLNSSDANPCAVYLNNLAPSGRRSMRSLLAQATKLLGYEGPLESFAWQRMGYGDVARIRAGMIQYDKSVSTINTTLAAIQGVLKAAFLLGEIGAEAHQRVRAIPRVKGKPLPAGRSLSKPEFAAMLRACAKDSSATGTRDAAVFALLAGAGLRRSEAIALDVSDYSTRTGRLRIRSGKGNKERELVLPQRARDFVQRWLRVRGRAEGPLFCAIPKNGRPNFRRLSTQALYGFVKRRAALANIPTCSPHDLRRTFITSLLDDGVDINTTRQLAGHEDIQTTARYDRRSEKSQRRAMAQLDF